jgi:hypothetical protein
MIIRQRGTYALLGAGISILITSNTFAQAVAICSDPGGQAFYHHMPMLPKTESGFQQDRITGGFTTLQRLENGKYDILITDARKQVISSRHDGARVLLLRRGKADATFLVAYPGGSIEIYTFYADAGNVRRFDLLSSKGGDRALVHKSSVMTGECSELNLQLVK